MQAANQCLYPLAPEGNFVAAVQNMIEVET